MGLSYGARSSLTYAAWVTGVQALAVAAIALFGHFERPQTTPARYGRDDPKAPVYAGLTMLVVAPLIGYKARESKGDAPVLSLQAAWVSSLIGLALGALVGRLLVENGFIGDWRIGVSLGTLAGSFAALVIAGLFSSGG
jgi:hypothetical protein